MALVYVAAEYDQTDLNRVKRLKFVCNLQTEIALGLEAGKSITINHKPYVLGKRETLPDNLIHYDLSVKK